MITLTKLKTAASGAVIALCLSSVAEAGPFILDLTDADDHGSATTTTNSGGWLYMQKVLENLAPGVTNGNKVVVQLGASTGEAKTAAQSAFDKSNLVGAGWTWLNIDGVTDITNFFNGTSLVNISNVGLIQLDSGNNVGGGITSTELAVLTSNAAKIDSFLGGGGGLHSLAQGGTGQYGWLSTLLPGLTFSVFQSSSLFLTAAGTAAFPGLTNGDLSSGPYHGEWGGSLGGLSILFESQATGGNAVGIGSSGGSITDPGKIPEPSSLALLGLGFAGIGLARRRQLKKVI